MSRGALRRCVALLGALALLAAPGPASASDVIELRAARVALSDEPQPPAEADPRWRDVELPDFWWQSRPGAEDYAWYRFELPPVSAQDGRWAVQLLDVSLNAAAFVNGEWIGQGGSMEPPVAQNANRSLAWSFPRRLLERERSVLDLRVYGVAGVWGRLGPVRLGPAARIEADQARRSFVQVTLPRLATALGAALFLLIGVIWLATARDPVYGWFLGVSGAWIVASLNYHVQDLPLPLWTWQRVAVLSLDLMAPASALLVHRLLGLTRPRGESVLAVSTAAVIALLALTPRSSFMAVSNLTHVLAIAVGGYAGVLVARHSRRLPRPDLEVFAVSTAAFLAIGAHDVGIQLGWLAFDRPRLMAYGAPLILAAFAGVLIARFTRTYARAQNQNAELERAVAEKRAELEASFARTAELERERVLAAERERLMREMHDGMGGQLVSALAMVRGGAAPRDEIASALADALRDMRLMLQSLDPGSQDLELLLALLRERIEPRLARGGLRLRWSAGDLGPQVTLSPEGALHVMRIVDEAVTNVIKHAKASEVAISSGARSAPGGRRGVFVRIADDGSGLRPAGAEGRGLANMRARAAALGGELRIASDERGTSVELSLPLAPATRPA